jgi:uncharacterized protein YndB with AHSA1/START domain
MTTHTAAPTEAMTTQVYRVYIKATPQRIWDAITQPEWNARYGYGAPSVYDLRPGGAYRSTPSDAMRASAAEQGFDMPDVIIDGEVVESDPPRKLVQTWRMLMDEQTAKEPFSTLTYEIAELPAQPGVCRLTVVHDLTGAPATAAMTNGSQEEYGAGGGWAWVLSDLKTLVETGSAFAA